MAFKEIRYKGKNLTIHKASMDPLFGAKTVLVTDTWDYVDLWLKRENKEDARFFWQQARSFFEATKTLPNTSSPLTAYYCFLNAVKALLSAKCISFSERHGVSGEPFKKRISLSNEKVTFYRKGILSALCTYLGEPANNNKYTLKAILYNLPYIHRAFDLSYSSVSELFIPINYPMIIGSTTTHEAWFCAELTENYANKTKLNVLPNDFEREESVTDEFIVRFRNRFNWYPMDKAGSLIRYINYHRRLRQHLYFIYGPQRLWYIKRGGPVTDLIDRKSLTLTFAAMHRLSELSRYTPERLAKYFEGKYNWLLSEFIATAPQQFIDEISSEMTGLEFMIPRRAS